MAKKKAKEKLAPIPRPTKRQREPGPTGRRDPGSTPPTAPDLSRIAEPLRPLAVPIDTLHFDPANAVTHDEANLDGIRGSLAVYGQVKPIVVRRANNVVIAGNGTLAAALSLGWTHLAAVFVEMDGATAAGYAIADNRTSDLHTWDKEALDKLLREVSTGNDERLDAMLSELAKEKKLVPDDENEGSNGTNDDAADAAEDADTADQQLQLLVICQSAEQQAELLERFTSEGLECRALSSGAAASQE